MSYTVVSWEISTGDAGRSATIGQALQTALGQFARRAPLLVNTAILDTSAGTVNVENIRRALDRVAASFPQEFFYTSSDVVDSDTQGIYPPWANIPAARQITGQPQNPRIRPLPPAPAGQPAMAGGVAPAAVKKPKRRPRRAKKAGPKKAGRRARASAKRGKK